MVKTILTILAILSPLILCGTAQSLGLLPGGLSMIGWAVAISLTVCLVVLVAAIQGAGPRIVIGCEGWRPWDFQMREHGPRVPAGSYEVRKIVSPTTRRTTIVLDNPEDFGLTPEALIGEDEEHLRDSIARGQLKAKLYI